MTFNPFDWVGRMQAAGYRIYLWDAHRNSKLGTMFENPERHPENDIELWREYRGGSETQKELNHLALYGALLALRLEETNADGLMMASSS